MKNILFLHSSAELYGSDKSLFNIINGLNREKYHIHVILPCDGPLVKKISDISDVDISIYDIAILRRKNLNIKGIFTYLKSLRKSIKYLEKYIDEKNIDIVETNTSVIFPGAIAAKRCKIKSIWHIREIINNKFENSIISFFMNRYSDVIIANSRSTSDSLKVDKKKIRIIYNSIEFGKKQKHTNKPIIGMAGRINRWKGQKLFVEAASLVLEKIPNAKFYIAGDSYSGEEHLKKELLELIKQRNVENSVQLLGQVNNMENFYSNINLFILPSINPEPFGLVVIEAMSYGIPVIATNHGGPVEIINNNRTGMLVDYKSPIEMADAIIELLMNKQKYIEISKNGIKDAREKYSIKSMIINIEKIYDETC